MRLSRPLAPLLALALMSLQACGGSDSQGPTGTSVSGAWYGGVANGNVSFQVTMTLAEAAGTITGTGSITGAGPDCNVAITGTREVMAVHLSIKCPGYQAVGFAGTELDASTITGHISGSGFPSTTFDLLKQ